MEKDVEDLQKKESMFKLVSVKLHKTMPTFHPIEKTHLV